MSEPYWVPMGATPAPQTLFPIDFRNPQVATLAGNVYPAVAALTVHELWAWAFRQDVQGVLNGLVRIAPSAVVTAPKVILDLGASAAGTTRLAVRWAAISDGESMDPAAWDGTVTADVVLAASRIRKAQEFALSGIAAGNLVLVSILHDGTHANDTLAAATELYGGYLSIV